MKERLILDGIIPAMNTPFLEDGGIDVEGLQAQVHNAVEAGVVGFMVPVFASEVNKLTMEERRLIVETVVEAAAGRVPIIGGTTAESKEKSLELGRMCMDAGCKGILCAVPYENDEQYTSYVRELAALNPEFLVIQDWSENGYGVKVDLVKQLFEEIPCFRSFKLETAFAGPKYTEVLKATDGQMHVSGGWAVQQMIEALDRGVHAFAVTCMPEIYCKIYELYKNGKRQDATDLFDKLLPVLAFTNQYLDMSIWFFKLLMYRMGYYKTPNVREPIRPMDEYQRRIAEERVELAIQLIQEVRDM